MSDQILQQILQELKIIKSDQQQMKDDQQEMKSDIQNMKPLLDENTAIVKAIRDRQEETDAKLENLATDVHQIHGEIARLDEKIDVTHKEIVDELQNIRNDLDFTYQKTAINEREIYKLKNK
ncbi:hypothetical protein [Alkalihalobacterium alkalinitrilicum]|uniref:hypothetical protein n=1 Tax=Alkalihalobacterium alkalinitrilicum TaxID=427920 RepID=UPI000995A312|nr:hypothetical protein [Alkalihalobacterium alkalinitrilicum]